MQFDSKRITPTIALFIVCIGGFYLTLYSAYGQWLDIKTGSIINLVLIYMMYTVMHESAHHNAHCNPSLNLAMGRLCAFHEGITFPIYQISHMQHHRYTNHPTKDPDAILGRKPRFLLPIWIIIRLLHDNQFMLKNKLWKKHSDIFEHVLTIVLQGLFLGLLSIFFGITNSLILWVFPMIVAGVLVEFSVAWLVHFPHESQTLGQHTRLLKSRVLQFLMLNHNLHLVHHLWPRVPWYQYHTRLNDAERLMQYTNNEIELIEEKRKMNRARKRVIITGAAGGLGLQAANLFSEKGALVVGLDIENPTNSNWPNGKFIKCDITNDDEVISATKSAIDFLGGVDILINNAGVLSLQDTSNHPTIDSQHCFDVNFWGAWKVSAKVIPDLIKTKGKIVNVSSLFAYVNAPLVPAYGASKRAISALSDSIRIQFGNKISVTTVYPGFMNTKIHGEAARQGLSVAKIIDIRLFGLKLLDLEESLPAAAKGLVKAALSNKRNVGTTFLGSMTLWFARHFPSLVDKVIALRVNSMLKHGSLVIELDEPKYS